MHRDQVAADAADAAGGRHAVEVAALEGVVAVEEARNLEAGRTVIDRVGLADLEGAALVEHHDPVAHRQRLHLVAGDVNEDDAEALVDAAQLDGHAPAQIGVERAQRLVEKADMRIDHERARQRHALLLPA